MRPRGPLAPVSLQPNAEPRTTTSARSGGDDATRQRIPRAEPAERRRDNDLGRADSGRRVWPVKASDFQFTQAFGCVSQIASFYRSDPGCPGEAPVVHTGIDLAAPLGTTFYAAASGWVTEAGLDRPEGLANTRIIIQHDGSNRGYATEYLHWISTFVAEGDYVEAGQPIGEIGSVGYSTGPHLHFAVIRFEEGTYLDPLEWLPEDRRSGAYAGLAPNAKVTRFKNESANLPDYADPAPPPLPREEPVPEPDRDDQRDEREREKSKRERNERQEQREDRSERRERRSGETGRGENGTGDGASEVADRGGERSRDRDRDPNRQRGGNERRPDPVDLSAERDEAEPDATDETAGAEGKLRKADGRDRDRSGKNREDGKRDRDDGQDEQREAANDEPRPSSDRDESTTRKRDNNTERNPNAGSGNSRDDAAAPEAPDRPPRQKDDRQQFDSGDRARSVAPEIPSNDAGANDAATSGEAKPKRQSAPKEAQTASPAESQSAADLVAEALSR